MLLRIFGNAEAIPRNHVIPIASQLKGDVHYHEHRYMADAQLTTMRINSFSMHACHAETKLT